MVNFKPRKTRFNVKLSKKKFLFKLFLNESSCFSELDEEENSSEDEKVKESNDSSKAEDDRKDK